MSGPPPKREAERRRRNKDGIETATVSIDELIQSDVEIPIAPTIERVDFDTGEVTREALWEPMVVEFWDAFTRSGQSIFYEPTDWMAAYVLMETLDRWLKPQEVKVGQTGSAGSEQGGGDVTYIFEDKIVAMPAGVITAIYKALGDLMAMEGPRRKLRIELERKKAIDAALEGANVVPITQSRDEAFERSRANRPAEA
jgi:hypothetical protein